MSEISTKPRDIIIFMVFLSMFSDFLIDYVLYNSFILIYSIPNVTYYLNTSRIYTDAYTLLGGNWIIYYGLGSYNFNFIKVPIAILIYLPLLVYNVFLYIYLIIVYFFTLINYPFSFLPYPLNIILNSFYYLILGIAIIFSIKILHTGLDNS